MLTAVSVNHILNVQLYYNVDAYPTIVLLEVINLATMAVFDYYCILPWNYSNILL